MNITVPHMVRLRVGRLTIDKYLLSIVIKRLLGLLIETFASADRIYILTFTSFYELHLFSNPSS